MPLQVLSARGLIAQPIVAFAVLMAACASDDRPSVTQPDLGLPTSNLAATIGWGPLHSFPDLDSASIATAVDARGIEEVATLSDAELVSAVRLSAGRVAIGFKPPSAPTSRVARRFSGLRRSDALSYRAAIVAAGAQLERTLRNSATVFASIDPSSAAKLRSLPFVDFVDPVQVYSAAQFQAPQVVDSGVQAVQAPFSWNLGLVGTGATITFLDTGVDSTHLADFSGDGPANLVVCAYTPPINSSCYQSYVHGSLVSSVASARNNCCGVRGVAYGATTNMIRVSGTGVSVYASAVIAALDWATSSGIPRHTVNMSFGGCTNSIALIGAMASARAARILLVASAGNLDGLCGGVSGVGTTGVVWPGHSGLVLAVSGTRVDDSFDYSVSRFGPEVALSAPTRVYGMANLGTLFVDFGTSYSSPAVSGVAAIVWSQNPTWTADQVVTRLEISAVDNGAPGRDQYFGFGRVSAKNAVQSPLLASVSGPLLITSAGSYAWSAFASGASTPYSITWSYRNYGSSTWTNFATGSSASRTISASTSSFDVRASVGSPTWEGVRSASTFVTVQIGGGCSPYCE